MARRCGTAPEMQRTDRSDRDELILRYLPLAYRLAARYRRSGVPLEDLAQIASLGLVKAADRFDPGRGVSFGAFAGPTIVGELNHYLRDCAWAVHVERPAQQRARRVGVAQRRISSALGRQPSVRELAQTLELSVGAVVEGLLAAAARETVRLDAPAPETETSPAAWIERLGGPDARLERLPDVSTVFGAARHLSRRTRLVLYLRFAEDLPQTEIARRIGVSQMQVSRIISQALAELREIIGEAEPARIRVAS